MKFFRLRYIDIAHQFVLQQEKHNFFSVYGMDTVLPLEVEIPSLKVLMEAKLDEAEWIRGHYEQLNFVEEKRLATALTTLTKKTNASIQ